MKVVKIGIGAAVLALAAWSGGVALSQDKDKKDPAAEMQEAMEAAMKPGPSHKYLMDEVGEWDVAGKMYFDATHPAECKGTSKLRAIFGGRYLVEETDSVCNPGPDGKPAPFHGMGTFGYDNVKKKYVASWVDDMGTGILAMEGDCDGKTLTEEGPMEIPGLGTTTFRIKSTHVDADHMTLEGWQVIPASVPLPEGAPHEMKAMELHYTRKK
ncbi:MAG TPA: DUF1579 family protein [Planctomycetota bacterium]|nr:DUF1579 family protein [Planctomycetota bacterium]